MSIKSVNVKKLGPFIKEEDTLLKGKDFQKLIPKFHKYLITMIIKNESAAVANAIRRTLIGELPAYGLTFDQDDFETDDEYLIWKNIQSQIQSIRISQDLPESTRFFLDVTNSTPVDKMVRAKHIEIRGKGELPFNETFRIITLRKGKFLKIKNIKIIKKFGYEDAKFHLTSGVAYKQLDITAYERGKGVSSMMSDCHDYELGIYTDGNIEPRHLLEMTMSNIKTRVKKYQEEMELYTAPKTEESSKKKKSEQLEDYVSDILEINILEDVTLFKLKGEKDTIANLIRYFAYVNDPSIPLVNYKDPHPTVREIVVRIKSKDPIKTFIDALDSAYKKFDALENEVKKITI